MINRHHRLIRIAITLISFSGAYTPSHAETIPAIPKAVGTVEIEASIRYAAWFSLENSFENFDAYCDSTRLASQPLGSCSNRLYTPQPVYSNQLAGDCIYEQVWWGTRSCTWLITGNIHYVCPDGYTHWATDHTRCINTQIEYTCPPDQGWTLSGDQCTREYSIELDRHDATIEPIGITAGNGKVSQEFTATVKANGAPKSGAAVTIRADVKANTGGHDHDDDKRPKGALGSENVTATGCGVNETQACIKGATNGDGQFTFSYTSSPVSGEHTLTATCNLCAGNQDKAEVKVMVEGLEPIPPSGLYALYENDGSVIGAVKNRHESNHYLTPTAAKRLLTIAINYHHLFPNVPVLHVNDASLMWGGRFDITENWGAPHSEHMRGTVIDIRANHDGDGTMPMTNFYKFQRMANNVGGRTVDAQIHCAKDKKSTPALQRHNRRAPDCKSALDGSNDINRHFHIRLMGDSE